MRKETHPEAVLDIEGLSGELGRGTRFPKYNLKQFLQQVIQHLEKHFQASGEAVPGDTMDFLAETPFSGSLPETRCAGRKEGKGWRRGEEASQACNDIRPGPDKQGSGDQVTGPSSCDVFLCDPHAIWTVDRGGRRQKIL